MKFNDLTGLRFGRLTVIKFYEKRGHNNYWLCKCDCGNEKIICTCSLLKGKTKSCGCYNKELLTSRVTTHNLSKTRLYDIFHKMKARCYNSNNSRYYCYGARGIKICDEWLNDFKSFYVWSMNNGYNKNLTIDRINNDGNYEPSNCRWVDLFVQANNKSINRIITYNNLTHTLAEWSKILNIPYDILSNRLNKHKWTVERAFTQPIKMRS